MPAGDCSAVGLPRAGGCCATPSRGSKLGCSGSRGTTGAGGTGGGCAALLLTQTRHQVVVIHHHLLVQLPLPPCQQRPLLSREIQGHVFKCHRSLWGSRGVEGTAGTGTPPCPEASPRPGLCRAVGAGMGWGYQDGVGVLGWGGGIGMGYWDGVQVSGWCEGSRMGVGTGMGYGYQDGAQVLGWGVGMGLGGGCRAGVWVLGWGFGYQGGERVSGCRYQDELWASGWGTGSGMGV